MAVKPGASQQDTKFAGRYKLPATSDQIREVAYQMTLDSLQLEQFALSSASHTITA
jgi:hypothetical protein